MSALCCAQPCQEPLDVSSFARSTQSIVYDLKPALERDWGDITTEKEVRCISDAGRKEKR